MSPTPAILIVDDDRSFVELTARLVSREFPGARVGRAHTGMDTMQLLEAEAWDVVLLDYRLPDIDGVEILGEIGHRNLDVAVIVVTGEGDEALVADLFRMGAYDYLTKGGVDAPSLRRCVEQAITRVRLERAIRDQGDELSEVSRQLADKARALDVAYDKLRERKNELAVFADSLEATVAERTSELQATSDYLSRVLDSAVDHFIIATGPQGVVAGFNHGAEAIFGRNAADVHDLVHFRSLFDELREDDGALSGLWGAVREAKSIRRTLTGVGRGDRPFIAEVTLAELEEGEGGLVIVGSDVTQERELERQNQAYIAQIEFKNEDLKRKNHEILEASRLRTEFLANVSHELRTPLNAIIGYSDLLHGGVYGELKPRQEAAVEGVFTRARDLLDLINQILDLAKVESGKLDLRPERFVLGELLEDVVETGRIIATAKADLEVGWIDRDAAKVVLLTDRQKLRQILLNLVNNSIKFTKAGFVSVETRVLGGDLEVAVTDCGIGIPAGELGAIFDQFRQVDGTSTREYGGTGLGLAISRNFADHLGGTLAAESVLGSGSTFRLRIPIEAPGAAAILEAWAKESRVAIALDNDEQLHAGIDHVVADTTDRAE
jgi:signal transduction histidine kinase/DNA-binding response OmpR family regulator